MSDLHEYSIYSTEQSMRCYFYIIFIIPPLQISKFVLVNLNILFKVKHLLISHKSGIHTQVCMTPNDMLIATI